MTNLWVGTEVGTLHGISLLSGQNTVVSYGNEPSKSNGIRGIRWSCHGNDLLCTLRCNLVNVFNTDETIYVNQFETPEEAISGFTLGHRVVTCTSRGNVTLWDDDEEVGVLRAGDHVEACERGGGSSGEQDGNGGYIITGGKENDLKVWDVEKQRTCYVAKNVPRDELDLRVPVWIRVISRASSPSSPHVITTGTHHHQFRVYDTRAKRRPVLDVPWGDAPITALQTTGESSYLGNGKGDVGRLDIRMGRVEGKFKGLTGGCRGLALHPSEPLLAAVSLDRFLRIYDTQTRSLKFKFYLKYQLNCVRFTELSVLGRKGQDDDVWDSLEVVERETKRPRRENNI